jgi:voltage-dependent potassium channel beta subunit
MGNILKKKGWDRSTYVVSSKVFWGGTLPNQKGLSRKHVMEACDAALKRLQVDYLDLYFCHRPDINTPIAETVWAMHHLIQQGKVLYWGTSEWTAQEITEAHLVAEKYNLIGPLMEQPQYNMFHRQRFEVEYFRLFRDWGMGSTIWSPLASGLLSGKYNHGMPDEKTRLDLPNLEWLKERVLQEEKLSQARKLETLAKDLGTSLPRLALAWCLKNPNVSTVITGGSKASHLKENLKATEDVAKLTPEVIEQIETILGNKPKLEVF